MIRPACDGVWSHDAGDSSPFSPINTSGPDSLHTTVLKTTDFIIIIITLSLSLSHTHTHAHTLLRNLLLVRLIPSFQVTSGLQPSLCSLSDIMGYRSSVTGLQKCYEHSFININLKHMTAHSSLTGPQQTPSSPPAPPPRRPSLSVNRKQLIVKSRWLWTLNLTLSWSCGSYHLH